ncbi:hypothetical protein MPTK1_7g19440 [Marchantia polymorpha subsp. ruderalis]|uniref:Uncharacterized protein n=2 Tax=Marchantia polymorpha TaxID=3197 RepID=A0AAF6C1F9_MARPO|nr:hypothetical protein MARPO_0067s0034 [Marchantia polymorpha]BBN18093.1 hypothetical protein Mp_7g19440 [Marchantia polymorpha subsp. ruderalis]|eukprot:PTQ35941.1 hypothetical protein MARPO_0067s0034 [Marchantia polymorpha]
MWNAVRACVWHATSFGRNPILARAHLTTLNWSAVLLLFICAQHNLVGPVDTARIHGPHPTNVTTRAIYACGIQGKISRRRRHCAGSGRLLQKRTAMATGLESQQYCPVPFHTHPQQRGAICCTLGPCSMSRDMHGWNKSLGPYAAKGLNSHAEVSGACGFPVASL